MEQTTVTAAIERFEPASGSTVDVAEVRTRILKIRDHLRSVTIQREEQVDMLILGLVTQQHTVMVGPPGTAKSFLCDLLAACIDGTYMTHLMTKFTTPDEIFGGVDFKALQADGLHKRNLAGGLADVERATLDEIFKTNGAMLDSLLKILNEGTYRDQGGGEIKTPLRSVNGASNEFPHHDNDAAYDRFPLRDIVTPIQGRRGKMRLLEMTDSHAKGMPKLPQRVTTAELDAVRDAVLDVVVPTVVRTQMCKLGEALEKDGLVLSDRRFGKGQIPMKAAAWLEGETECSVDDLQVLRFVYWTTPADRELLIAALSTLDKTETARSLSEIDEALRLYAGRPTDRAELTAAIPGLMMTLKATGETTVERLKDSALSKRGKAKIERRMAELKAAFTDLQGVLNEAPLFG